ncbi:MAG TPA: sulfate permease, partial [Propionibacteriaceae bacterium]|nr:sulfate permease [Propionibacteriaceae bacterium]
LANDDFAAGTSSRTSRFFPGIPVLRHYRRAWLRGDLVAGCTVAAYLIPQVMAYAEVAGLPPVTGLWAVMGPLVVYAVLGSSRQLSVGPESTTALMTATALAALTAGGVLPGQAAAALAIAVGAICLVGWLARLGFLANLLSHPILTGYMAGIAVLMIISQLDKFTGIPIPSGDTFTEIGYLLRHLDEIHLLTFGLAVLVLALLIALRRWIPAAPGPLVAVVGSTVVVALFDLQSAGVAVVGEIPAGLPRPSLPDFGAIDLAALVGAALGITVVGYTDNVLTARAFAIRGEDRIDPRQEFLALGAANLSAGVLQGFPVSSSGSRTAVGDAAGSRTQLHSLVALGVVLLTLLALRPVLAGFPMAALAAIVVFAALRLIDVAELRRIARFRRSELVLAVATTVGVLAVGVLYGIAVAVAVSVLDLLRRIARPHDAVLGYVPGLAGMHDIEDYQNGRQLPGLLIYRYDSPLFFANAEDFERRSLAALEDADHPVRWFVLNIEAISEIDITGADALENVRQELANRSIVFGLARLKMELRQTLATAGFLDRIENRVYATLPTAVEAYQQWCRAQPPGEDQATAR